MIARASLPRSRWWALASLLVALPACDRGQDKTPVATPVEARAPQTLSTIVLGDIEGEVTRLDATGARHATAAGSLQPGDVVTAGDDGRALVRLSDGRELILAPGTRLRVGESSHDALSIELESGTIVSRRSGADDGAGVSLSVLTPFGITRIPAGPGKLDISLGAEGAQVAVELGGVTFVDRAGRELSAKAGERIEVTVGGAQLLPAGARAEKLDEPAGQAAAEAKTALLPERAASDLVLPTARKLRIYADRLSEVTLTWPPALAKARIEVSRDPAGKDLVMGGRTRVPRVTLSPPREGDLYWRIIGADPGKVLRGHAQFRPDRGRSVLDLANPQNLVTERSEGTKVYFQGARPALTFSYAKQEGARRYRVRVFRAGALAQPIFEQEVTELRCPTPPGFLDEGSYLWHAQGIDGAGRILGGSRLNKLELVYENALNTLVIGRPRSGDLVVGDDVPVSGVAPLGERLFVNGHPAPTDDKGRFDLRVERASTLIFKLVGRDGRESYWVRRLRMGS
ncbi:MAG TPA: hypothetical protein VGG33_18895 [Polyangia bacterium]